MDRRNFIRAGLAEMAALSLPALGGCGGGSDSAGPGPGPGPGPAPACRASGFAMGLSPATPAILAQIAPRSAAGFSPAAADPSAPPLPLPAYFDLTDSDMLARYGFPAGMLPPPASQGSLGSCVAWGVGYAAASFSQALRTATLSQSPENQVSPADLYAKTLARESGNYCGNGTLVRDAMDVLVDTGVASLREAPYDPRQCRLPVASARFTLDGYHTLGVTDSTAIKAALCNFNVLPFGMQVYPDFQAVRGSQVYNHPAGDASCALGGHCMALIGYSDERAAYRLINSWDTSWGEQGYAWMSYETFARLASEVYAPYMQPTRAPNTFYDTASAHAGSIHALRAYSLPARNGSTGKWDAVYFSFLLNDALAVGGYRLYFYPASGAPALDLGGKPNTQVLRGSLLQFNLARDDFLTGTGWFALNLTGRSRLREDINLTIFSSYPDPNGR